MRYKIVYDSPGRIRLRCGKRAFKRECESALISYITSVDGVDSAEVSYVNGGILIYYSHGAKQKILDAICSLDTSCLHGGELTQAQITDDEFKKDLKKIVIKSLAMKMLCLHFCVFLLQLRGQSVCKRWHFESFKRQNRRECA